MFIHYEYIQHFCRLRYFVLSHPVFTRRWSLRLHVRNSKAGVDVGDNSGGFWETRSQYVIWGNTYWEIPNI